MTATRSEKIHPRTYGTFPRVFSRYVRELGALTEAEAIRKMTGLPAARIGFTDRGRIDLGFYADIVAYDPDTITDVATFQEPHRLAAGVRLVLVNGRVALEEGTPSGERAGRVLRHSS